MNAKQLAEKLNGRFYGKEITSEEEKEAIKSNLIVVFHSSDDLLEYRGVIHDEDSGYNDSESIISKERKCVIVSNDTLEDELLNLPEDVQEIVVLMYMNYIKHNGIIIKTNIDSEKGYILSTEHESFPFTILEEEGSDEIYGNGLVIQL